MHFMESSIVGCSYFPLYPPAPGSMLDASLGAELDLPCTPDILILPSDLAPFAKLVAAESPAKPGAAADAATTDALAGGDVSKRQRLVMGNVVCVNPGRLAKDKSGGTFAKLQVFGSSFTSPIQRISLLWLLLEDQPVLVSTCLSCLDQSHTSLNLSGNCSFDMLEISCPLGHLHYLTMVRSS